MAKERAKTVAAQILDGKGTARTIRGELAQRAAAVAECYDKPPGMAAIMVGDDPGSQTYVSMKGKLCEKAGIAFRLCRFPADATQEAVVQTLSELNFDSDVHGILIQHPVPKQIDEPALLDELRPIKDVDGMTPDSIGRLFAGNPRYVSCTAAGIVELLDRYQIPIEGKQAVVLGRSIVVGRPAAALLLLRHATVTVCHSRTRDLDQVSRAADILVAGIGRAEMVKGDWIKPGAVVVDAGYNRVEGRQGDVGDVDFEAASQRASWITPVPGGCGPMTIAMLLSNTIRAAELQMSTG
jgi:methylenetetrahydrofolate dehydrogenase (NADP+)/methenyltetrahydrofolate cyclohydrolase